MKPPIKTIFSLEHSKVKINFVPNGIQLGFEMAEKKMYKQTDKQINKQTFSYL